MDDQVVTGYNYYDSLLGIAVQRDFSLDLSAFHNTRHDLTARGTIHRGGSAGDNQTHAARQGARQDGFTGRFNKVCWAIIKSDVMKAFEAVQRGHVFKFRLLNTAFITLLPKKLDVTQVKDYRPISLIHSFTKLVAKLMANRLASVLPQMVAVNQSAL